MEFLSYLDGLARQVQQWHQANAHHAMRPLVEDQEEEHEETVNCYLCKRAFDNDRRRKVRDHDHFTGDYLGAACNKCNLARRVRKPVLPVIFHNFRGYDAHHLLKHVAHSFPQ